MNISRSNTSIVCMVPAKGYSERVPNKNLRFLGDKPLVEHVLDTLEVLDIPVYLNSDSEKILKIAKHKKCIPYKRSSSLCTDDATNDDFMFDFMKTIESDYVLQVLPTSPFITIDYINEFIHKMITVDTLVSVLEARIGCVYSGNPINFSKTEKNPRSQDMCPVKVYATSLMGWKTSTFIKNMKNYGCAYHGGKGITDYYTLEGISTIDIDKEEDFQFAEYVHKYVRDFKIEN